MRFIVNSIVYKSGMKTRFKSWLQVTTPSLGMMRFRFAFAAIWLTYDLVDLIWGGTQAPFWLYSDRTAPHQIAALQIGLVLCELSVLLGFHPQKSLLLAFFLRAFEAWIFPLNDFLYYIVTALLLAHFESSFLGEKGKAQLWVRQVLVLETAWIYFSTALLKLNPSWLSGGDLYSRQMFQISSHAWPYPMFYKTLSSGLPLNAVLAWSAVVGEFSLALLLGYWCLGGKRKRGVSGMATVLVILIHGFAAVALNVWFFGASMIAQVSFLTASGASLEGEMEGEMGS